MKETTNVVALPLHIPQWREWELTNESTYYDSLLAAPSDNALHIMWIAWLIITTIVTVVASVVFAGILSSRKVRSNPYNQYLLFLMVPDISMSGLCIISCLLNVIVREYFSTPMCIFQSFYIIFGIGANAWLNGVIAFQIHSLLKSNLIRRKHKIPTKKAVVCHSLAVYLWSAFVASWSILNLNWLPHHTKLQKGEACLPVVYDKASAIFFALVFFPSFVGIPLFYVAYVTHDIWKRKLIPPTGKRRSLTIYFFRLIAVFVIMWGPSVIFIFIVSGWAGAWPTWAGGTWAHLQGGVSAAASLAKPDIYKAVKRFVCCRVRKTSATGGGHHFGSIEFGDSQYNFSSHFFASSRGLGRKSATNIEDVSVDFFAPGKKASSSQTNADVSVDFHPPAQKALPARTNEDVSVDICPPARINENDESRPQQKVADGSQLEA